MVISLYEYFWSLRLLLWNHTLTTRRSSLVSGPVSVTNNVLTLLNVTESRLCHKTFPPQHHRERKVPIKTWKHSTRVSRDTPRFPSHFLINQRSHTYQQRSECTVISCFWLTDLLLQIIRSRPMAAAAACRILLPLEILEAGWGLVSALALEGIRNLSWEI